MTLVRQVKVKRVDWFRVLADLRAQGLTLRVITACTGISKPTLLDLRNQDADPKMHQGELLIALWVRETGQGVESLPRHGEPRQALKQKYRDAWEGGTIHCPLCGTEHATRAPKVVKDPGPAVDERQMALV
jgi:lambda repressor-like predicted transcriptional regulator